MKPPWRETAGSQDREDGSLLVSRWGFEPSADIDPAIKVRILGLNLLNVVGPNVLTAAVNSLRQEIAEDQKPGNTGQNSK
jgi:hypothetical protein